MEAVVVAADKGLFAREAIGEGIGRAWILPLVTTRQLQAVMGRQTGEAQPQPPRQQGAGIVAGKGRVAIAQLQALIEVVSKGV